MKNLGSHFLSLHYGVGSSYVIFDENYRLQWSVETEPILKKVTGKKKVLCNRKNMVRVNEDQRARRLRQVQDIRM